MALHDLTEDEEHWIGVAIEQCLVSAQTLAESDSIDDQLDAGLLVQKYTELNRKFPAPMIGGNG